MHLSIAALALALSITSVLGRPTVGVEADLQAEATAISVAQPAINLAPVFPPTSVEENEEHDVNDHADADAAAAIESTHYDWEPVAVPDNYKQEVLLSERMMHNSLQLQALPAVDDFQIGTTGWTSTRLALLRSESQVHYTTAVYMAVRLSRSRASQAVWKAMDLQRQEIGLTRPDPDQLFELKKIGAEAWFIVAVYWTQYLGTMREIHLLENAMVLQQLRDIPEADRTAEQQSDLHIRDAAALRLRDEAVAGKELQATLANEFQRVSSDSGTWGDCKASAARVVLINELQDRLPGIEAVVADLLQSPEALQT